MDPEVKKRMDEAAMKAAKEFQVTWSAEEVAKWLGKWTHEAGLKRLGRIILNAFGITRY